MSTSTADSAFTVNVQRVYPKIQHKLQSLLETHQLPALANRSQLRDGLTSCWFNSIYPYVVLVITRKILSELSFKKIYVTQDIISSNPVLIVLTLYRFSVQTLLNARESLSGHSENSVTSQLLKSVKFYLTEKRIWKR